MATSRHKPWIRFTLSLLALTCLVAVIGCAGPSNETWHCYDRNGKPVQGVVIVCRYSLAGSGKAAVNCRFSDATGKVVLDLDKDTPHGLERGYECIYSSKLKSGDAGRGQRWHEDQPIPDTAVYFDEWNNKIYLKSGVDDPVIWHSALTCLISSYDQLSVSTHGGAKLGADLSVLVPRERALFLEKYGDQVVPIPYLKSALVSSSFPDMYKSYNAGLKFKDITLPLPKP